MTGPQDRGAAAPTWARRLRSRAAPDCWIGIVLRVIDAERHEGPAEVIHTPDHYLAAAWAPPAVGPTRWPEAVALGSPQAGNALAELFLRLPPEATLHLAGRDEVDVALAAAIVRHTDRNLEAYQIAALDRFIAAERAAETLRILERYTDSDPGFDRFRAAVGVTAERREAKPPRRAG